MRLTEGGRLERPNICWICKRTPQVGTPVVDTEKYFDGWPFEMNGRLYVCETCATQIAGFFGLIDKNSVEIAHTAQARAEAVVRGVKLRLDTMVAELKDIAADPSVFMEAEDVSTDLQGSDTADPSDEGGSEPSVDGAAEVEPVEGAVEAGGSEDSGSEGGLDESLGAQQSPSEPATTNA